MCCLVEEVSTFEGSFPQTQNSGQFFFHHSSAQLSSLLVDMVSEQKSCVVLLCVSVVVCLLMSFLRLPVWFLAYVLVSFGTN